MISNVEQAVITSALDQEAKRETKETTEVKTKMNGRIVPLLIGKSLLAKMYGILELTKRRALQIGMAQIIIKPNLKNLK